MTIDEKIEANADLVLWCVHVLGPDDVHAAPNHEAAVAYAQQHNKALLAQMSTPADVLCFAYPAPWPHSKDQHAEALKNWTPACLETSMAYEIKTQIGAALVATSCASALSSWANSLLWPNPTGALSADARQRLAAEIRMYADRLEDTEPQD